MERRGRLKSLGREDVKSPRRVSGGSTRDRSDKEGEQKGLVGKVTPFWTD